MSNFLRSRKRAEDGPDPRAKLRNAEAALRRMADATVAAVASKDADQGQKFRDAQKGQP